MFNGNRERATSGQEQQERQGEQWPSGGGAGGLAKSKAAGSVSHQSVTQDAKTSHFVHDYTKV
jgi:hypothetical protein